MANLFITGAARGIGNMLARRALTRGDTVFAAVRQLADRNKFPESDRLHLIVMDVSDTQAVERGFAQIDQLLGDRVLDAVVNSAAIAPPGAIELMSEAEFEQVINTNALGSLRIMKQAIPRLRGHGGRLVLVTSLWGQAAGALLGAYCASKHAVEALADVARRETAGMNLHIIVAEPGVVITDMYKSNMPVTQQLIAKMTPAQDRLYGALYHRYFQTVSAAGGGAAISVERAAAEIERALHAAHPATRYRFGMDSKLVCFLAWLLPDRWMDALMGLSLSNKPLPAARR